MPIPSRRALVATWLVLLVAFGTAVTLANQSHNGLDDPNQAYQRPGFLDARDLPDHVPAVVPGVPGPGRRAVVFFVRPAQLRATLDSLTRDPSLRKMAAVAVVDSSALPVVPGPVPAVVDPSGRLASAYGMRRPLDGGPPVGYAVVDSSGRVRYATLDPGTADRLAEVSTILGATP